MARINWLRAFIMLITFSIVGGIFIYLAYTIPIMTSFYFMGAFFIVLGFVWFFYDIIKGISRTKRINNLTGQGIKGTATIVEARTTGVMINRMPRIKFKFRISLPGRQPYEIKKGKVVGYASLGSIGVGATFPCWVSENNPKKVYIQGF